MKILKNFISEEDLEIRWNLNRKQLEALIREWKNRGRNLTMWYAEEIRQCPDGVRVAFVKYAQYLSDCIFDMDEVLTMEASNPELLAQKVEVRGRPVTSDPTGQKSTAHETVHLPFDGDALMENKSLRTTQALISLKELVKRWTGATEQEIITEERTGRLVAFHKDKTLIIPDTLVREHWLIPCQIPTFMDFGEECLDLAHDCVFLKNNVIAIEKDRPDFLYRLEEEAEQKECIGSPQRVDAENQRMKQVHPEQGKVSGKLDEQLTAMATALPQKRTDAANHARQDKNLAMWKATFPCMVRIYARMEQGRTYTRKEVATLFEAEGVEVRVNKEGKPTGAMFGYFWQVFTNSGLPIDDLSNCRWSPDVSAATTTDPVPDDN